MTDTTFHVDGTPAPQGSKRHVGNGRLIESSKLVKPWRDAIVTAAQHNNITLHTHPDTHVIITFYLRRPKAHYTSTGQLKNNAPQHHTTRPDLDKLVRSTFDALTLAGFWRDDALVCRIDVGKKYAATGDPLGAWIEVSAL